jgi:hypothetical protein
LPPQRRSNHSPQQRLEPGVGQCRPAISSRDLQRRSEGPFLDVAVAQSEAEIEPNGLLDDDARKAVAAL